MIVVALHKSSKRSSPGDSDCFVVLMLLRKKKLLYN